MPRERTVLGSGIDALFIAAINGYQKYLSLRKGWRCAYGVLHGGPGCSGFAKSTIQAQGWRKACPVVRQRFAQCQFAAHQLRAQRAPNAASAVVLATPPTERRKRDCVGDLACDFVPEPCSEAACEASSCEAPSCDVAFCDFCACSW